MRFYFIRHAQSENNRLWAETGTAEGRRIDPTLTGFQDGPDWKPYIIRDHASMELIGFDEGHIVDNVLFDNVVIDGEKVEKHQVSMNEFVKNVHFK